LRLDIPDLSFGWREGLLALVVVLALYMLVELWRVRRLRRRAEGQRRAGVEPSVLQAAYDVGAAPPEAGDADDDPPLEPPPHLAEEAFMRGVESELAQMREELDALRGEFAALREEMRHEATQLRASQTVSPLYSDAMQMAVTGYGADVIAERCGISRAEAELVAALVKNQQEQ
jgi:HAMP domain-containing protein